MSLPEAALLEPPEPAIRALRRERGVREMIVRAVRDPFAARTAWTLIDQVIYSAANFVTAVCIGRMCGKSELGLYYVLLSVVIIARGVQDQVTTVPYMVYCHRRRGRSLAEYKGSVLSHQMALAALAVVVLLALSSLAVLVGQQAPGAAPAVWILASILPWLLLREGIRRIAFAHMETATAVAIDLSASLMQIGGLIALGAMHRLSVPTAFLVLGAANAVTSIGWIYFRRQTVVLRPAQILSDWQHNWSLARWTLPVLIVALITPSVPSWALLGLKGSEPAGVFAACFGVVAIAQSLLVGVANFLTPQAVQAYAREHVPGLRRVLVKSLLVFLFTVGAVCAFLMVTGGWVVTHVYGPDYRGNGWVVAVAALAMLVHCFGNAAGNGLLAMERPQANLFAEVAMLAATLFVAALTIGPFGPLGAALTMLAGAVTGSVVRCAILLRMMASAVRLQEAAA